MFDQDDDSRGTDDNLGDYYDAEILDEMTTHRGELKLRTLTQKDRGNQTIRYRFGEERQFQVKD